MGSGPQVILVDDNEEELRSLSEQVKQAGAESSEVFSPGQVREDDLIQSDLVIVDYTLDEWIDPIALDQISLKPIDGIALAAVLRQHSGRLREFTPTGFALITGKIDKLGPLPDEWRPHVISRLHNLEWLFEKRQQADKNATQIVSLARAVSGLAETTELGTIDGLMKLLNVSDHELKDRFKEAVLRCRPPIHHLSQGSNGLVLLRWLLHRILPYTAFLFDSIHLAARLGTTADSLSVALGNESALEKLFRPYLYTGPLDTFDGTRWWREGIEQVLWDITDGKSSSDEAVLTSFKEQEIDLEPTKLIRPVVTVDQTLKKQSEFAALEDVVALQLDDWPSYAEPAYMRKQILKENQDLRIYVANDE